MTKVVKPDNWSASFDLVYDAWNRLVIVKDGATVVATYSYDGLNRRVKKVTGATTRTYYFNRQWQCLEEYNPGCNVRRVFGLRYVDDLVYHQRGDIHYALADANWNVVAMFNTTGNVIDERYTYSAFGKVNTYNASFAVQAVPSFYCDATFTGQVYDHETGLMLYRNRVYHPTLGRFVQRDPIGYDAGDVSLYRYVGNRTNNSQDIYGLFDTCPGGVWSYWGMTVGGALIIGTDSAKVTFSCHKANVTKKRVYNCGTCGTFTEKYYVRARATGIVRSLKIGASIGGGISGVAGVVRNAPNISDLSGYGWTYIYGGIDLGPVGFGSSIDNSGGGEFSPSLGLGLGLDISTQWTYTWAKWTPPVTWWDTLDLSSQRIINANKCKVSEEPINPPEVF